MWYDKIFIEVEKIKDEEQSRKMGAYMKNKFYFLGIPKPLLDRIIKPFLKESRNYEFDWQFVQKCWEKDYREAQYIGIAYLEQNRKYLIDRDLDKLKNLIINKSWWETVDSIDSLVGEIVLKYPSLELEMISWSLSENIWLRRVAIDYQQRFKEKTNKELLEKLIVNNLNNGEFFINKAIGWSLREYSKIDITWVKEFIQKYKDGLSNLSIKEASKYLDN